MIIPVLITPRTWSSIPSDRAAVSVAFTWAAPDGSIGLRRTPTRVRRGRTSLRRARRFASNSELMEDTPVMFRLKQANPS
jgi:hypothetical protein